MTPDLKYFVRGVADMKKVAGNINIPEPSSKGIKPFGGKQGGFKLPSIRGAKPKGTPALAKIFKPATTGELVKKTKAYAAIGARSGTFGGNAPGFAKAAGIRERLFSTGAQRQAAREAEAAAWAAVGGPMDQAERLATRKPLFGGGRAIQMDLDLEHTQRAADKAAGTIGKETRLHGPGEAIDKKFLGSQPNWGDTAAAARGQTRRQKLKAKFKGVGGRLKVLGGVGLLGAAATGVMLAKSPIGRASGQKFRIMSPRAHGSGLRQLRRGSGSNWRPSAADTVTTSGTNTTRIRQLTP
jgi:hypothetical protein